MQKSNVKGIIDCEKINGVKGGKRQVLGTFQEFSMSRSAWKEKITEKPCLFRQTRAILQTKIFSRTELPHRPRRKSTSHLTVD